MASEKSEFLSRLRAPFLAVMACLMLAACSFFEAPPQLRGNKIDPEVLKELVPGTTTKSDVSALVGSPTVRAAFDDNTWIYVSELTRPRVGRYPAILEQNVVLLVFNDDGVLSGIEQKDKEDSLPVQVVSRITPSPGTEASFFQQLFGNIGRFNTLSGAGGGGGGMGGAPGGR